MDTIRTSTPVGPIRKRNQSHSQRAPFHSTTAITPVGQKQPCVVAGMAGSSHNNTSGMASGQNSLAGMAGNSHSNTSESGTLETSASTIVDRALHSTGRASKKNVNNSVNCIPTSIIVFFLRKQRRKFLLPEDA